MTDVLKETMVALLGLLLLLVLQSEQKQGCLVFEDGEDSGDALLSSSSSRAKHDSVSLPEGTPVLLFQELSAPHCLIASGVLCAGVFPSPGTSSAVKEENARVPLHHGRERESNKRVHSTAFLLTHYC